MIKNRLKKSPNLLIKKNFKKLKINLLKEKRLILIKMKINFKQHNNLIKNIQLILNKTQK